MQTGKLTAGPSCQLGKVLDVDGLTHDALAVMDSYLPPVPPAISRMKRPDYTQVP